jgi:hypothetical protein
MPETEIDLGSTRSLGISDSDTACAAAFAASNRSDKPDNMEDSRENVLIVPDDVRPWFGCTVPSLT